MKEIIDSIRAKLTDDKEANTKMLLEELEKNKNNKEVVNEIYKMLYETLPEDLQNNFVKNINQEKFQERMKEIQELIADKQYDRSLKYLDMAIDKLEQIHEDDNNIYMTFHDPFTAYLYAYNREDKAEMKKIIKNAPVDFGVYYKFKGLILNELKRFAEAEEAFVESLKWNPLDFETVFGYAKALYELKKYDEFLKLNRDTLDMAYMNYAIASCYHNIGKYYLTKNTKEDDIKAYNIISYSISFSETDYAYKDLDDICVKYKMPKELAKEKDVFNTLKSEDIQPGPSEKLVRQLIDIARSFIGKQDKFALQVFKVIYQLTHDEITLEYIKAGERAIAGQKK